MRNNSFYRRTALAAGLVLTSLAVQGAATITIINADPAGVGFNDTTVVAPVGGNNGTTRGQQRLNVFNAVAAKWGSVLTSAVPIQVRAVWTALSCNATGAVLGSAGANYYIRDVGAGVPSRWYTAALANKLAGVDLDPSHDISANFNVNLGNAGCLTGIPFYLGLDNNHGANMVDLYTVVLHEMGHGLGFLTITDGQTGAIQSGFPMISDDFLFDNVINKTWSNMTPAERVTSALGTNRLAWIGPNGNFSARSVLTPSGSSFQGADNRHRPLMYSPNPYQPGSSVSHWTTAMGPNQIMEPAINGDLPHEVTTPSDLTFTMLADVGWQTNSLPKLNLTKTHTGNFTQGQAGATYTITVSNSGNAATSGTVFVLDTLPSGLTATSIVGSGWTCSLPGSCSRGDALLAGSSYPAITVTVNVASNAVSSVTNKAEAWGGGGVPVLVNDPTTITGSGGGTSQNLTVTKTHSGNFTQGQTGATYTITVTNVGTGPTNSTATITDTLPAGLTATSLSGSGWSCLLVSLTCFKSGALAAGASHPPITLTVNVAANAPASVTNSVTVSGGGDTTPGNNTANDVTTINPSGGGGTPDLTITKTHSGNFTQGQNGATYTVTVTNSGNAATSGTVTVTDTIPAGLTLVSMAGTGWTCAANSCNRNNALAASTSYPAVTVTVNVAANAASSVTNTVVVSGGGESNTGNDTANDPTTVNPSGGGGSPDLTITKTHTGNFTQGQSNAAYTITVTNGGTAATSGTVTVTDTLPTGLTLVSMSGSGWTCAANSCNRSNALNAGNSYPAITLTVNVAANAAASITNTATVSGGGDGNGGNNTANDPTTVNPSGGGSGKDVSITKTHTGNFTLGQVGATYTITVTNIGTQATSGLVNVTDTLPTGLTATAVSGAGWSCNTSAGIQCLRAGAIAAGASTPPITLTVNVAANAPGQVTNVASVTITGDTNLANNTASDLTTIIGGVGGGGTPDATITKTHSGNFTQGQTGATYTITVTNSGTAATSGTVTVVDTVPAGLTATAIAGTGWACTLATKTCTRSDALGTGASYPAITLTVDVAANAPASVTNNVTVSGGGESNTANNAAADLTNISTLPSGGIDFTITKTHTGNFTQGQAAGTYTITVTNAGTATSSGLVTVVDTLPTGLTATAMSGSGWLCVVSSALCMRSTPLVAGASYPAITLTVSVAVNAPASVTNSVRVSNSGDTNAGNNVANDATTIGSGVPSTIGIYRNGKWYIDSDGDRIFTAADRIVNFGGLPDDVPLTGDARALALYRGSTGDFVFDDDVDGTADRSIHHPLQAGEIPIVGDWNGDGRSDIGVFSQGIWRIDSNGDGVIDPSVDKTFQFGSPGNKPVVGDWNSDGKAEIGVFNNGVWTLDTNGDGQYNAASGDETFTFGEAGNSPIAGSWTGTIRSQVGVARGDSIWLLDTNGNHTYDGYEGGDEVFSFMNGFINNADMPVVKIN